MAFPLLPLLATFAAFVASLLVPLFLIPEALRRMRVVPWRARLVGWIVYVGVIAAVLALGNRAGFLTVSGLLDPWLWILAAALTLAAAWDLRQVRRRVAEPR